MQTTIQTYRMDRRQISFIKFILEAYDNMAVVTTLDPYQAVVRVTIAPGCETAISDILNGFAHEFGMVALDQPVSPVASQGSSTHEKGTTIIDESEAASY
jgi:hypothetical protein